jgi:hypothetical protein
MSFSMKAVNLGEHMSMKKELCNELFHENPKPWRAYEHEEEALA